MRGLSWLHLLIMLGWRESDSGREKRDGQAQDSWISLVIISRVDLADKTVFALLADGKRIQYPQIILVNMTHLQQNEYKPVTDEQDYF